MKKYDEVNPLHPFFSTKDKFALLNEKDIYVNDIFLYKRKSFIYRFFDHKRIIYKDRVFTLSLEEIKAYQYKYVLQFGL